MESYNLSEMGVFIGICSSALIGVILATQKSKCEEISCCGLKCKRNIQAVIEAEKLELTGHTGSTPRKPYLLKEGKELQLEKEPEVEKKI